jgi:hypothetical protein
VETCTREIGTASFNRKIQIKNILQFYNISNWTKSDTILIKRKCMKDNMIIINTKQIKSGTVAECQARDVNEINGNRERRK